MMEFTSVAPRYINYLRLHALIECVVVSALITAGWLATEWLSLTLYGIALIVIAGWLLLDILVIVKRQYHFLGYCFSRHEIQARNGAWWQIERAVPINRVQHSEVTQGPIERLFGLAKLTLYTAGGSGADLSIPGLLRPHAEQLKQQMLDQISDTDRTAEAD